jgi:TnpA family transposase
MEFFLSDKEIRDFWHPIPISYDGLNNKKGTARFIYLILLHYFYINHKFPDPNDLPSELILYGLKHVAGDVNMDEVSVLFNNERQLCRYKEEIRTNCGYRLIEQKDIISLKENFSVLFSGNANKEALKESLIEELDRHKIERISDLDIENVINKIQREEEYETFSDINELLTDGDKNYIDDYILSSRKLDGVCQFLRQDSGATTRENVKLEIKRLEILNCLQMEKFNFVGNINTKQRNFYKRRFLTDTPERAKRRPDKARYALAIIFCFQRHQEAIDNLVEHLLNFIHRITKTTNSKTKKLNEEVGKRMGDLDLLYQLAEINRDCPQEIIEEAVYPEISQELIDQLIKDREFSRCLKKTVQESVIKSYSSSYRGNIIGILDCLKLHSSNMEFLDAINLINRHHKSKMRYYPIEEDIPIDKIMSKQQQKHIFERDESGNLRVLRKDYECIIFQLLRRKLMHKEVWVSYAYKYRDPMDDLPKDFEQKIEEYCAKINMPVLAKDFINNVQDEMVKNIQAFDNRFLQNDLVNIVSKKGKPWILLTPFEKAPEPKVIHRIKEAILDKWGVIDLLDILKEVDLRENFTHCFSTAGNRSILDRETIRKRLLFSIFSIGTNTGLKRTAGASKSAVTFEELRHIKNFFLNRDDLREAINTTVNAIFRIRNPKIWRSVSTACAGDSKQFGCFSQNLMSEWSPRHHNNGVMIYWHVSDQYICVYSQLKTCTSSEVSSMLQGIVSQETDMDIEYQYVDSHGKSELGFALSYLEGFDLLPRYKTIGNQKIYLPSDDYQVKNIKEITTRSIDFQLIEDQYYEMIKHSIAIRLGTATAETIIRKFARSNYQHPTFKAFIELGRAIKTNFLCRYLNSVELRQQINAGLNVVENWNSANDFVYYGKGGEITSNCRDDQEISMLCLHMLQTCISYVNTLLIEDLLQDNHWIEQLGDEDYRALNALFYLNINPYGTFDLDLTKRLIIGLIPPGE